jgi:hypothetical protein
MPTTYALRPISPVIFNEGYRYVTNPLAAAQDFKKGAPAFLNTTGTVQEAGVNPAAILGFFTADAAQYAWKDDTLGTVDPAVPVALSTHVFRGTLKGTFAAADVGASFGLTEQAGGIWTVDRAKTGGDARVVVLSVEDEVAVADIDVPITFTVIAANRQVVI